MAVAERARRENPQRRPLEARMMERDRRADRGKIAALEQASESQLDALRDFSPAAARFVRKDPSLARYLKRAPPISALTRIRAADATAAARALRVARTRMLVHTAALEASGRSPLRTASLWSRFADIAVALADKVAYAETRKKYGPPKSREGGEMGRAIFALGKHGAQELNPSSDIDLLLVYGTDDGAAQEATPHEFFQAWVQRFQRLLSAVDDDGFAFRVDLDLRPEGQSGPLVNSVDALERYYERFGLMWERAALTRLRPVVDVRGVGSDTLSRLRPFVFPRRTDPSLLEELAEMRARIEASARSRSRTQVAFDVKRSVGGIRDVEFAVQALQLLYGGRFAELREGTTVELVLALEALGYLDHQESTSLCDAYVFLRRVEHALQLAEDRQTHDLPASGEVRERVERVLGGGGDDAAARFAEKLAFHTGRAREVFSQIVNVKRDDGVEVSDAARIAVDPVSTAEERRDALEQLGFDPVRAAQLLNLLRRRRTSPLSPIQIAKTRGGLRLAAEFIDEVAKTPNPDAVLARLPDIFGTRLHHALMERLSTSPRLMRVLLRTLAVSAPLSRLLARQSGLEATLLHGMRTKRVSLMPVTRSLRAELTAYDEEEALTRMRRVQGRVTLSVGLSFLAGRMGVTQTGLNLSVLADALLQRALELAHAKVAERHGHLDNGRFSVLALGSLGGRELGFFRDLDLLFVYDGEGETDGRRALSAAEWAGKLGQQVMWILSAPLAEGPCYEVDPRLRPSGNQGPLCVRLSAFEKYHATESALWERQALLRLRPVAGDQGLAAQVKKVAHQACAAGVPLDAGTRLLDMRAKMVQERAARGGFDVKMGDGGMVDIEFAVQALQLKAAAKDPAVVVAGTRRALHRLVRGGHLDKETATTLRKGLDVLATTREAISLVDDARGGAIRPKDHRLEMIARAGILDEKTHLEDPRGEPLYHALLARAAQVREVTHRILHRL